MVGKCGPRLPFLLGLLTVVEEVQVVCLSICNTREVKCLTQQNTMGLKSVVCREVNFVKRCEGGITIVTSVMKHGVLQQRKASTGGL